MKVIIERKAKKGHETDLVMMLRKLRAHALMQPGYISGETLAAVDDPTIRIVISAWHRAADWKAWEGSAERAEIEAAIEPLLAAPARIRAYVEV